jgi:sugar phosphate isomerase/epimerase
LLKLGISTWSFLGLDVYSAIKTIGDAGSEYVELWGELPHAYPGWVDKNRLMDVLSSYDMVVSTHAPFTDLNPASFDPHVRDAVRKNLEQFVEFSAGLGASMVTAHPGTVHSESLVPHAKPFSVEAISAMVKTAGGRLSVNIENQTRGKSPYNHPLGSTIESLEELLSDVKGTRCTLDTGHAHASGLDPQKMAARLGGKLAEVHLSDNAGGSDDHLAPGEGTAPLKGFMEMIVKRDVLVCLELNPYVYGRNEALERLERAKMAFG